VALFMVPEYRGNPMQEIAAKAVAGNDAIREVVNLEDAGALCRIEGEAPVLPDVAPHDPVQIQYTSGTTGFPKGAVLTHRNLTNNARLYGVRAESTPQSVWPVFMPLFHTVGCAMCVLGALQVGCKILVIKVFDPGVVLALVQAEKVTELLGVPTMLLALVEAQKQVQANVETVNVAISGGSMVAPDLVRSVRETFQCEFETVYGQTETSPVICQHHSTDTIEEICNSVGQPLPQTEASIRSVAENAVVPVGTVGEICVRGYLTMTKYHNNPDGTAAAIDGDNWLHTGDLGTMDSRGYIRITGRVKEMIIRGGENLFPAEIENTLLEHEAVAEVAVVGLPDDKWGEIVACFVRSVDGSMLDPTDLKRYCRAQISPQKTPAVWVQVEAFPLTGSGKIKKFELRDEFIAGALEAL